MKFQPNPGKREISRDSVQYPLGVYRLPEGCSLQSPLEGDNYLETDCFLAKKQENNL